MAAVGNIEALWAIKYRTSVELSVQGMAGERGMCAGGGMGPALGHPQSPFPPELLDCDRCGNGCTGGYIWDAFITVLNNSECRPLWGLRGVGVGMLWGRVSSRPCSLPGGLSSEKDYPYQGKARVHKCQAKKYKKVAWIQDFIMLPESEQSTGRGVTGTDGPGQRQTDWATDKGGGKRVGRRETETATSREQGRWGEHSLTAPLPQELPSTWPRRAPSL